jgi:hypothetical protein
MVAVYDYLWRIPSCEVKKKRQDTVAKKFRRARLAKSEISDFCEDPTEAMMS